MTAFCVIQQRVQRPYHRPLASLPHRPRRADETGMVAQIMPHFAEYAMTSVGVETRTVGIKTPQGFYKTAGRSLKDILVGTTVSAVVTGPLSQKWPVGDDDGVGGLSGAGPTVGVHHLLALRRGGHQVFLARVAGCPALCRTRHPVWIRSIPVSGSQAVISGPPSPLLSRHATARSPRPVSRP